MIWQCLDGEAQLSPQVLGIFLPAAEGDETAFNPAAGFLKGRNCISWMSLLQELMLLP